MSGISMASEMFGKTYIVKVLDDGECITEGELIRCKECKYKPTCEEYIITQQEDAYCSWADRAERKEDKEE